MSKQDDKKLIINQLGMMIATIDDRITIKELAYDYNIMYKTYILAVLTFETNQNVPQLVVKDDDNNMCKKFELDNPNDFDPKDVIYHISHIINRKFIKLYEEERKANWSFEAIFGKLGVIVCSLVILFLVVLVSIWIGGFGPWSPDRDSLEVKELQLKLDKIRGIVVNKEH
jgi:hypothetical protein